jgi:3-phenylpropionate/cinnamic acid dioxygenase small subunit
MSEIADGHLVGADAQIAIHNALARYAYAYDMDQLDLLDACFAQDAEVWFSTGRQSGREAVLAELHRRRSGYRPRGATPWHIITNVFARQGEPNEILATSYFSFGVHEPGQAMSISKYGRYDDVFVLEAGQWRIARRRIVPLGQ